MKLKLQKIIIAWLKSSGEYNSLVYELSQKLLTEGEEIERLDWIVMDGHFDLDNLVDLIIKEQCMTDQFRETINYEADYNLYYCNKCDLTNDAPGKKCIKCGGDTVKVEGRLKKDFDENDTFILSPSLSELPSKFDEETETITFFYGKSIANGEAEKLDKENIKFRNYLLKEAKETLSGDALNEYLLLHSESKCRSMSGDALESLGIRSIFSDKDETKQTETPFFDAFGNKLYLGDKLIMDDEKDNPCILEWDVYRYVLNFSGEKFDTCPDNNGRLVKINN